MALKRWLRIGGPAVAAALVAIAILPPRVPGRHNVLFGFVMGLGYYSSNQPVRSQFTTDVLAAKRLQEWRLARATLADSLTKAAHGPRALVSRDHEITVVWERPLSADSARFWLEAATRELALYPRGAAPAMPLVVALLMDPGRDRPSSRSPWGVQALVDQAAATGACVVTVSLHRRQEWLRGAMGHDAAGRPVSRILGTCALYSLYGLPAADIARWVGADLRLWAWSDPITTQLMEARHHVLRFDLTRPDGGSYAPWYDALRWAEIACLGGASTLCLRAAGLGAATDWLDFSYYYRTLPRGRLMAYLLATGTARQFGAFWRSTAPPATALADAYGRPAGDLVMTAMRHWYEAPAPPRPWGSMRGTLAGAVWLVLAVAVALAAGRRWSAGI